MLTQVPIPGGVGKFLLTAGSLFKLDRQSLYFRGAMRTKQVVGPILGLLSFFAPFAAAQDSAKSAKLTIEQLIEIKHPSNPVWSPDGKHVVFSWDRAGVANLYVANADGHGQPVAVTSFSEGQSSKHSGLAIRRRFTFRTTAIFGRRPLAEGQRRQHGLRAGTNLTLLFQPTQRGSRLSALAARTTALRTKATSWSARSRVGMNLSSHKTV